MSRSLSREDVVARLRRACAAAGSAKNWAQNAVVSPQYVSDVISGRREPGESIAAALELERVVRWVYLGERLGSQNPK